MAVTKKSSKTPTTKSVEKLLPKTTKTALKKQQKAMNAAPASPEAVGKHAAANIKQDQADQKISKGKTVPVKPDDKKVKSGDDIKRNMLKPALDAMRKEQAGIRSEQLLETGLLVIEPKDAKIPLEAEAINASIKDVPDGVVEYEVTGTSFRLLGMAKPNETPTLAQRLAIARRLLEVGPKLPKYVKTIEQKKPDFSNAEIQVKRGEGGPAEPKKDSGNGATKPSTSTVANGVPLKKICADINIDPKLARRILRSKGKKPGGRWEWESKDVDGIKTLLTTEAKKLADAGKA